MGKGARREKLSVEVCENHVADQVILKHYWMPRIRRSRRLSYLVRYAGRKVAWVQVADVFGTKLAKSLQSFSVAEAVELCRGYFRAAAPTNIESCAIAAILRRLPNDWHMQYGVTKKIAVVYQDLDAGQAGVVYRAMGFKPYALCVRARHFRLPSRGGSTGKKVVWARALRPVSGHHYRVALPQPVLNKRLRAMLEAARSARVVER
jgi:hypothetical protein